MCVKQYYMSFSHIPCRVLLFMKAREMITMECRTGLQMWYDDSKTIPGLYIILNA